MKFWILVITAWVCFGCGITEPDRDISSIEKRISDFDKEAVSELGLVKAFVGDGKKKNHTENTRVMKITITLPKKLQKKALKYKGDNYLTLRIMLMSSSEDKSLNGGLPYFSLILGRMELGEEFIVPQPKGHAYEVSFVNIIKDNDGKLVTVADYTPSEASLSMGQHIVDIRNGNYGCAYYCLGETAIFEEPSSQIDDVNYSFILLFAIDKPNVMTNEWKISVGLDGLGSFSEYDSLTLNLQEDPLEENTGETI